MQIYVIPILSCKTKGYMAFSCQTVLADSFTSVKILNTHPTTPPKQIKVLNSLLTFSFFLSRGNLLPIFFADSTFKYLVQLSPLFYFYCHYPVEILSLLAGPFRMCLDSCFPLLAITFLFIPFQGSSTLVPLTYETI